MEAAVQSEADTGTAARILGREPDGLVGAGRTCASGDADCGNWDFTGSTYFGCRDPHVPLELMFAFDQARAAGHDALLIDAQTDGLDVEQVRPVIAAFSPDFLVIPSAPSYLFWRCPPPELRVPMEWFRALGEGANPVKVAIGPHSSATPAATLRKTGCDVALRGEPDQIIPLLASEPWDRITGCCYRTTDGEHISASFE